MSHPAPAGDPMPDRDPRPAPHRAQPRLGRRLAPRRSLGDSTPDGGTTVPEPSLHLRCQVRLVGGEAGRALAAAQGRALADLLASVVPVEVGRGEEDTP
ncbi:MAG: hypothetical protein ACYCO3_10625 [Mycobacteriales bacterium]